MATAPNRRVILYWMFEALGFLFVVFNRFTAHSVMWGDSWAALLFDHRLARLAFLGAIHIFLLIAGILCWITAYGLKRGRPWARTVGLWTSGLLLPGFPWIMLAGGVGLFMLLDRSWQTASAAFAIPPRPATDFWDSKRKSKLQAIVLTLFGIAAVPLLGWFILDARRAGMPAWQGGWRFWLWYSVFGLLNTMLHESGHAIVAWAAGFELRVICVGPFTFLRERARSSFRFRFDLNRLFERDGYMGAVPVSDNYLRPYEIAVIAAGPAANALSCLICLTIFFSLPGTAYQAWWWVAAFNAVMAGVLAISNLVPLGYCDGTMLLHLILWTPRGRLLLDIKRMARMEEEAKDWHNRADFGREIELREEMLRLALAHSRDSASMAAACQQTMGSTCLLADDAPAAEYHYRKCMEFGAEMAWNPALEANTRAGLLLAVTRRHRVAEVGSAYAAALATLHRRKAGNESPSQRAVTCAMLAQTHCYNRSFQAALEEIEQGLRSIPPGAAGIQLRARLLRTEAVCLLNLGRIPDGLAAAQSSAAIFRSPEVPAGARNLAWENLATLGSMLWQASQSALPIELLREAIPQLESGGALLAAAQYRIKLAGIYRQLGHLEEACAALPTGDGLPAAVRCAFLAERAQLHLATSRPDLAVADCRELVTLWRAHPYKPAAEIASAEALLAAACLAAGNPAEATALAKQAAAVLGPWQHPDAASCIITLALAQGQPAMIDEAFRLIDAAPLLGPVEKTRLKNAETARIQRYSVGSPVLAPAQ